MGIYEYSDIFMNTNNHECLGSDRLYSAESNKLPPTLLVPWLLPRRTFKRSLILLPASQRKRSLVCWMPSSGFNLIHKIYGQGQSDAARKYEAREGGEGFGKPMRIWVLMFIDCLIS
jgi:hypothetical protein